MNLKVKLIVFDVNVSVQVDSVNSLFCYLQLRLQMFQFFNASPAFTLHSVTWQTAACDIVAFPRNVKRILCKPHVKPPTFRSAIWCKWMRPCFVQLHHSAARLKDAEGSETGRKMKSVRGQLEELQLFLKVSCHWGSLLCVPVQLLANARLNDGRLCRR